LKSAKVWYWRQMATWSTLFKQAEMAIEYWERIRALLPNDAAVLATLAGLHAGRGRASVGVDMLRQSIRLDDSKAYTHFNLGFLLQEAGSHDEALACFSRALELNDRLDQAYYGKGLSLIKLGRLEEAVEPLRANIKLQPLSPYGFYQLVHALHRLGRPEEARRWIVQLSGFEPQVARQLQRETGIDAGVPEL
jgi:tetratricopeptide (TPR) repeat protein